ncbi:MAG: hypothetical protein Tsb0020_17430 [Haliangiales bacterium]
MTARILLITALILVGGGLPAVAQERPNEVVPIRRAFEVNDFQPRSGPVGTEVTISGRGFRPSMKVFVGGQRIKPLAMTPESIRLRIPARYGDGRITVRFRKAGDVQVGVFQVIEPFSVTAISPTSGLPGTRVQISGEGFSQGDQVLMNGRSLAIEQRRRRRLSVRIPGDASSDYLTVVSPDGRQARSPQPFEVLVPAPVITGLDPAAGPAGTVVRVRGQYFAPDAQVFYGNNDRKILSRGPDWLEIRVPRKAKNSRFIRVVGSNGEARSPAQFDLIAAPTVERIAPTSGPPGTRVEIYGSDFAGAPVQVSLGGLALEVLRVRPKRMTVRIPKGAKSGQLVVERGGDQALSPEVFEVWYAPELFGFAPQSGTPGTEVTLSGSGFAPDAAVYYGSQRLDVTRRQGQGTLVVNVPPNARRNERFSIRARAGTATSKQAFGLHLYPELAQVRPDAGYAGTRVVLSGRDLAGVDAVLLGQQSLPIVRKRPSRVEVQIPSGAQSGQLALQAYGQVRPSPYRFEVLTSVELGSVQPLAGMPGTQVTLYGGPFTNASRVRLGRKSVPIVRQEGADKLIVQVPLNARGSSYFTVEQGGRSSRAPEKFTVLAPPQIRSFSPSATRAGLEIELRGRGLGPDVQVYVGKRQAVILGSSKRGLRIQVPPDVKPGPRPVRVVRDGYEAVARRRLLVEAGPEIVNFSPRRAKAGGTVVIAGRRFARNTRVYWGQQELAVERRDRRGSRIEVRLPPDIAGTDYLYLDDGLTRVRANKTLEIQAQPSGGIIRDHRKQPR